MKLIKRIGALLVTVALLCSLLMFVPNNVTPKVHALEEAGLAYNTSGFQSLGCDLSFYNVSDNNYANGYSNDDSGANYSLVDFEAMKADGCDFAILRLGSEDSSGKYYDPHFVTYYNMAREAGMQLGVYYYSYALTYDEAVEEAEFCIEVMESYGMYFEYPIYIDIEESDQLTSSIAPAVSLGWCDTMEAAGYFPGIYGNYNLYDCLTTDIQQNYDIWLAYVSSATSTSSYNPSNTDLSSECSVWQYSFYGYEYDGIGLDMLDVNVSYKDYPTIMATYGYNNVDGSGATKTNVSKDATYYPPDNTRTDDYVDDGVKLTDGSKGSIYGGETARYAGWYTTTGLEIVVDLGAVTDSNTYNVYAAANSSWGIDIPSGFTVSVSDSLNGTYTEITSTTEYTLTGTDTSTGWSTYLFTVSTEEAASARYVKFTVAPNNATTGSHVWLDEVEAIYDTSLIEDDGSGDTGSGDGSSGDTGEDDTTLTINSLEFSISADATAGGNVFTPTLLSVNGSTALTSHINNSYNLWYTIDSIGGDTYESYTGTTFESGYIYDLYIAVVSNSTATFATDCTLTVSSPNNTYTGTIYSYSATDGKITFDVYFDLTDTGSGDGDDTGSGDGGDTGSGDGGTTANPDDDIVVGSQEVYITGFNTSIVAGAAQIFTPDFGTVSSSTANITWTMNAIAKYDEELDAYVVTQVFAGGGSDSLSYDLADDEILIAVHDWETGVTDGTEVSGSAQNFANLSAVQAGMLLEFSDIDLDSKSVGTDPIITFYNLPDPVVSIGAKANEELGGIRFGATYNKVTSNGQVTGLGFLIISADKLGDNTLDLNYASNSEIAKYVAKVECRTIEDYVEGKAFEDYASFTFYATVIGLGNYADEDIVAVPYITYLDGDTFCGEAMTNSVNGVLNGESSF